MRYAEIQWEHLYKLKTNLEEASIMSMEQIFQNTEDRMAKSVHVLSSEYAAIRAGRANPAVLDKIMVDYYGTPTPINQLAAVSVTEARTLTISPWDASVTKGIEKAIQTSDLGINPQTDGKTIRIIFPQLTEDRRRDIVKDISQMGEEAKVAVRSIRRDAIDKLKKMKKQSEITEDDLKHAEKHTQQLTDQYCKEIDEISTKKEKEIMAI